jgi:hypothetical protein
VRLAPGETIILLLAHNTGEKLYMDEARMSLNRSLFRKPMRSIISAPVMVHGAGTLIADTTS